MDVIEFHPDRDQYAFTFGGVTPIRKVQPGTMMRLWTDDAFCGNLRDPADMPSAKLTMPFVNPQTGPFYVEGAEPGDTLALHFADLSPARDWGASSTIPLFGGLTGTDRTATLHGFHCRRSGTLRSSVASFCNVEIDKMAVPIAGGTGERLP